ncbi:hypothetical protein [Methylobacterium nigriterrae]|uniref:hypothetical protein n=1 Tax=Methylobacterium nigriterrae TaxID=3127512 RepID=UPI003013F6A2
MSAHMLPVVLAGMFVAGCLAIQALHRWADQVTEALGGLLFVLGLFFGVVWLADYEPRRHTASTTVAPASATAMYGGISPRFTASATQEAKLTKAGPVAYPE